MRRILGVSAVALAGLLAGCGGGGGGGSTGGSGGGGGGAPTTGSIKPGGTVTVALAEDPDMLDPTLARTFVGRIVFANMCEKLYDLDAQLHIVPQLAAALPKTSKDGRTVTIRIRDGIKFNDGTTLDAKAVKTSLDRHRTLPNSGRASELAPVTSVQVVDPSTVRLKLKQPFAPLTSLLADRSGMIMSPKQLHKLGDKFANDPVCVGPFQFASRSEGDRIVLDKAKDYYDADKVKLDHVVFKIVTEPSARAANVRSGDVDVAERLQATDVKSIQSDPNLQLLSKTWLGYQGLTINVGNKNGLGKLPYQTVDSPLGAHKELRQAFNLALDRNAISRVVFQGGVTPGCTPLSPASPWHDPTLKCPARDIAKAKQLVAQSGVKTPIPITLIVGTDTQTQRLGQAIQSMEKEAGFAIKLQPTEFTTGLDKADAGQFDVIDLGWSGRVDPDGNIHEFVDTKGSLNDSGYSNPRLDKLLDESRTTLDMDKRKALYGQIQRIILDDDPLIYLGNDKLFTAVSRKVAGLQFNADGLLRLKEAGRTG